ncbi:MAG TPA: SDR family oxidoreductase [Planctomycetota bacterium]|nr:SDR family oxidoreductase [Planctomycetota bacterium]
MDSGDVLAGRTVLITGSTGIAARTAELAAGSGARVFVTSRTPEHGEELARRIGCTFIPADLTAPDAAERVVRQVGALDALFNVAGISGRKFGDGPLHECTDDGWDVTLDTNVKSMFLMCRSALRQMMTQAPAPGGLRGTILNMASVLGFAPQSRHFATHAYAASKGAILAMSRSMAAYYAPHKIRVNVIAPALVRTPMSQRAQSDPAVLELMKTKQPLAEDLIDALDVARAAMFLLSDDSRMITGDTLTVDAGWCVSG